MPALSGLYPRAAGGSRGRRALSLVLNNDVGAEGPKCENDGSGGVAPILLVNNESITINALLQRKHVHARMFATPTFAHTLEL